MFGELPPTPYILAACLVVVMAVTLHEFCHAWFADLAGDDTPRLQGRVTLNPVKHFDPLGALMFFFMITAGFGFAWGRPVQANPARMNNPRWDWFISVAAGPLSNLLQACLFALATRYAVFNHSEWFDNLFIATFLSVGFSLNLSMFIFNLLPIGPLDGHWMVGALLPPVERTRWYAWNRTYGTLVLIGLIVFGGKYLDMVMGPIADAIAGALMGTDRSMIPGGQ